MEKQEISINKKHLKLFDPTVLFLMLTARQSFLLSEFRMLASTFHKTTNYCMPSLRPSLVGVVVGNYKMGEDDPDEVKSISLRHNIIVALTSCVRCMIMLLQF